MNLLIAESDFGLANALKPRFEAENYAVDTARDTEQSVSMLRRRKYQAAIVDFDRPLPRASRFCNSCGLPIRICRL
jgi:DNA-binding response OmpR family regulator